jgi:DNA-binding NarL/FixJ family response regulator
MGARLMIVEDNALFAELIAELLRAEGADVVGLASSGREALAVSRREQPEVVLMDLGLEDVDGLTVGRAILAERPTTKVVAVTARRDKRALDEATASGFAGYVTKDVPLPRFLTLVKRILSGHGSSSPVLGNEARRPAVALAQLSSREKTVLELLREGLSTEAIARSLGVSKNTIRTHIQRILMKLQVHSRLEAVAATETRTSSVWAAQTRVEATNG